MSETIKGTYIVDVSADMTVAEKQIQNLQRLIETLHPVIDFGIEESDLKDASALIDKLSKGLDTLKKNAGIDIDLNYSSVTKASKELEKLNAVRKQFEKIKNTKNIYDEFKIDDSVLNDGRKIINAARDINKEINKLSKENKTGNLDNSQIQENETRILSLKNTLVELTKVYDTVKVNKPFQNLFDAEGLKKIPSYTKDIESFNNSLIELGKAENENKNILANFKKLGEAMSSFDANFKQAAGILESVGSGANFQPLLDVLNSIKTVVDTIGDKLNNVFNNIQDSSLSTMLTDINDISRELTDLRNDFKNAFEIDSSDFSSVQSKINSLSEQIKQIVQDSQQAISDTKEVANTTEKMTSKDSSENETSEMFSLDVTSALSNLESFSEKLDSIIEKLSKEYSLIVNTNITDLTNDSTDDVDSTTDSIITNLDKQSEAYKRAAESAQNFSEKQDSVWDITQRTKYYTDADGNERESVNYTFKNQYGESFTTDENYKQTQSSLKVSQKATEFAKEQKAIYGELNDKVKERLKLENQLSTLNLNNEEDLQIGLELENRITKLKSEEASLTQTLADKNMTNPDYDRNLKQLKEQTEFNNKLKQLTDKSKLSNKNEAKDNKDYVKEQISLYKQLNEAQQEVYKNRKSMASLNPDSNDDKQLFDIYEKAANEATEKMARIREQIRKGSYTDSDLEAALENSRKQLANEVQIAKIKAQTKQTNKDNSTFAKEQKAIYGELESVITKIYDLNEKYNKTTGTTSADEELRLNYEEQIIDALKEENKLRQQIKEGNYFDSDKENELEDLENELVIRNANKELERQAKYQQQVIDLQDNLNNKLKTYNELLESKRSTNLYSHEIAGIEGTLGEFSINDALNLDDLNAIDEKLNTAINSLKKLGKTTSSIGKTQTIASGKDLSLKSTRKEVLETVAAMYQLDDAISECNEEFTEMVITGRNLSGQLEKITLKADRDSGTVTKTLESQTKSTNSFVDTMSGLGNKLSSYIKYFGVSEIVYGAWNQIQKGVDIVREYNSAMTELRKVTNLTEGEYSSFARTAAEVGNEVGRTMTEVTSATADFSRLGYEIEEATALAKNALIMTNIGDGIELEDATSAIVSTLKGFEMDATNEDVALNSQKIIDSINNVSNNFALSTQDIATAIQKMSAVLHQGGTSFDETIGMFTAGMEVMQDASKVSTGLITISQRIRGISDEGEDLTDLQPKLEKQFNKMGLTLLDTNGELKSTYQIFDELSQVWDLQSSQMQQYIGELMAGKNQISVLQSTLQNWSAANEATSASINSTGSALKENEAVLDSIEGKIQQFNAQLEVMWNNSLNSEWVKGIVDIGTAIVELVDKIGLVPTALTTVASVLSLTNIDKIYLSTTGVTPGIA